MQRHHCVAFSAPLALGERDTRFDSDGHREREVKREGRRGGILVDAHDIRPRVEGSSPSEII